MTKQLEVVYEDGVLRPLQPLPFAEKQHLVVTVTDELSEPPAFNAREREQEWIRINALKYPGKWVAVEESQLVGLGDSAKDALDQARARGVAHPLLVQIPRETPLPFAGW